MNIRKGFAGLPAAAFVVILAGCGSQASQGTPTTQARPTSSAPSTSDSPAPKKLLAPPVPKPLKYEGFHNTENICLIISQGQASKLGLTQPKVQQKQNDALATGCTYKDNNESHDVGFSISFENTHKNGLSDIYAQRSSMAYWVPVTIQGYPGVLSSEADGRTTNCSLTLGVTDQVDALIIYDGQVDPTKKIACQKVQQVGDEVVTSLKRQN